MVSNITLYAQEIIGLPRVIDGDTVHIGKYKFRLEGIDAPEIRQECKKESLKISEGENVSHEKSLSVPLKEARENFEKKYLSSQLKKFGGNISKMAKFIGMERSALHRKLKGLNIKDLN